MPQAPKRICRQAQCQKKTKNTYCEDHKHLNKSWDKKADPWYNKPVWKGNPNKPLGQRGGLREAQLLKEPYCEHCKQEGIINDVTGKGQGHVDHIIPFRSVPKMQQWAYFVDQNNHQTLCRKHNMQKASAQGKHENT